MRTFKAVIVTAVLGVVLCAPLAAGATMIQTYAGTGSPGQGTENVPPTQCRLYFPMGVTVAPGGRVYIADWNNHVVRVVENGLIRTVIGSGLLGAAPEGNALDVGLNHPTQLSVGPGGNLYLAAWQNSKIMKYDVQTLYLSLVCNATGTRSWSGDGGPAADATLNLPSSTAWGPDGNLYISDQSNHCVRMIDMGTANHVITTVVALGHSPGFCGDGGAAINACLHGEVGQTAYPGSRLTFDGSGNLYLADTVNHCIRKVDTNGIITTIAGNGTAGYGGDGGNALLAQLNYPADVAVGPLDGDLYIADRYNHRVRRLNLQTGVITTFAGNGTADYTGDGGPPEAASLKQPSAVSFGPDGTLYIADTFNSVIRTVSPETVPTEQKTWGTIKNVFRGGTGKQD